MFVVYRDICIKINGFANDNHFPDSHFVSNAGLHLTLFIEQMEYVGILTEETGVRLAIHPREMLPHPEEVGFSMAPGFSTSIGIRQVRDSRSHGAVSREWGGEHVS